MSLILEPDRLPIYSNLGFDVLGHTLARIHGTPYEQMVLDLVVGPLGLLNTGVNITDADDTILTRCLNPIAISTLSHRT